MGLLPGSFAFCKSSTHGLESGRVMVTASDLEGIMAANASSSSSHCEKDGINVGFIFEVRGSGFDVGSFGR